MTGSSTEHDDSVHSSTAEYEPLEHALSSLPPELLVLVLGQLEEKRSLSAPDMGGGVDNHSTNSNDNADTSLVANSNDNADTSVVANSNDNADTSLVALDEPCPLLSLPPELLRLVLETLENQWLASFAAASVACLSTAHGELRAALLESVQRCLLPDTEEHWYVPDFWRQGQVSDALVSCPYFRLPEDLVSIPAGFFRGCSMTKLTLPVGLTSIGNFAFRLCLRLTKLTIPATLTHIGQNAFVSRTGLEPQPSRLKIDLPLTRASPALDRTDVD